jgi:hypothetical protein
MRRSHVAWGIAALDIVAFLVASLFDPARDVGATFLYVVGIGSFAAVGALLSTRVPANPIGVLLLAAGTILGAAMVIGTYADLGALQVPPWPGSGPARIVANTLFVYPFVIALIGVPLVFPDGHLPSRRFRWVVRIAIANMVAWTLGAILGALPNGGSAATSPGPTTIDSFFGALQAFVLVATLVSFGGAVVAIWVRFRRGNPVQRQQVKWLVAVVGLGAIVLPVSLVFNDGNPELAEALASVTVLTLFALPIVIGIAILRYRLYEIDRIISRTIGWITLTAILATVFAAVIVGFQALIAPVTENNTMAVAASTLVAAALFQPLRRRVQRAVDRRFNRSRVDAERTVDAFAEEVRNDVDLAALRSALRATADDAVRPASTAVWLRTVPDRREAAVS